MATPGWVKRHRRRQQAKTTAIRAELLIQATERVAEEKTIEQWTPRRGMSFASEGER